MGKTVWKRSVLEVTIADPVEGQVLATSKIGDNLLGEGIKKALPAPKDDDDNNEGFVPWNRPVYSNTTFHAGQVGTYFVPLTFKKLTGM